MNRPTAADDQLPHVVRRPLWIAVAEVLALVVLFFIYAGDPAPAVNEAHYLVKAKNFWDPSFCAGDLFVASGKAHWTFYVTFGFLTRFASLSATAWIGRLIGWTLLAVGLQRCSRALGLPPFACLGVAVIWLVGIEYGNLAGEWVVGGIEAKVPAYAMVLFGISEIVKRNWSRGWIWFGGASAFHVLTGGWAVVACAFAFLITERWFRRTDDPPTRFLSIGLFVGGVISLFGLLPAINLTMDVTPEDGTQAARIYSYVRLRHHLLPSDFPLQWFIRHGVLACILVSLAGSGRQSSSQRRLTWIATGALAIAGCGLVVGSLPPLMPDLSAKLLRYYWFRLSDAIVPLALALLMMQQVVAATPHGPNVGRRRISMLGIAIATGLFLWSVQERSQLGIPPATSHRLLGIAPEASVQQQRRSYSDWVSVCDWVRVATPTDEIFLTPRHQQSFKWYAQRAEVVNWKDVPQDAKSLLEWRSRFDDVYPKQIGPVSLNSIRVPIGYSKLRGYRKRYGVRFMIVDNRVATDQLPLAKLYPIGSQRNETYSVYELPND